MRHNVFLGCTLRRERDGIIAKDLGTWPAIVQGYIFKATFSSTLLSEIIKSLVPMGVIRAADILAIDNKFRTLSLELKCLGTSFGGAMQKVSLSLGIQHGRRVIKAHWLIPG